MKLDDPIILTAFIVGVIVLFLIGRTVNLWYFRINEAIDLMHEQNRLLKQIGLSLGAKQVIEGSSKEPVRTENEWKCPNCKEINPNTTFKCESCGYALK